MCGAFGKGSVLFGRAQCRPRVVSQPGDPLQLVETGPRSVCGKSTVGERAGCRGRALSQPFVAPMWLIRKIRVRRNIATAVPCNAK